MMARVPKLDQNLYILSREEKHHHLQRRVMT
jgi:hypothetical protein